ncbi:hypothetical protein C2S51_009173 [Perilla frutescens var. frutescens]|nr:hypothetical protein C2S51_009173 [Perilla frutescens var. frutescens]
MKKKVVKKQKESKGVNVILKILNEATSCAASKIGDTTIQIDDQFNVEVRKNFKNVVEEKSPIRELSLEERSIEFYEETQSKSSESEFVVGVYPVSRAERHEATSPQRVRVSNARSDASWMYVRYLLPPEEKSDADIHRIAKNPRQPQEVSSSSVNTGTSNEDLFTSEKFFMLVDEVVANFKAMQEESKISDVRSCSAGLEMQQDEENVEEELARDLAQASGVAQLKIPAADNECMNLNVDVEKREEAEGQDEDVVFYGDGFTSVGPNGSQYLDSDSIDPWLVAYDEWSIDEKSRFQSA